MATVGQPPSLKKREASSTREEDQLIITPLGAGNEVGRSCVYMSYKGKIVLVLFELIIISHLLSGYKYDKYNIWRFHSVSGNFSFSSCFLG